jgi:hypothetical protein
MQSGRVMYLTLLHIFETYNRDALSIHGVRKGSGGAVLSKNKGRHNDVRAPSARTHIP